MVNSESVSLLFNQLALRSDTNGSNRIDGRDLNLVTRLAGKRREEPEYRRPADVNLDGIVDGVDLGLVCEPFGSVLETTSSLRSTLHPLGFVELWVRFEPVQPGLVTAELVITNNDPQNTEVRVPLRGQAVSPAVRGP